MEIHKPHAAKTWKEFFIELGTIVLGILVRIASLESSTLGRAASEAGLSGGPLARSRPSCRISPVLLKAR